jgi:nucleoside-diphosphate-sugar epimerase
MVTGGLGFIGINLTKHLISKGEKVICYDLSPSIRSDFYQNYIDDSSGENFKTILGNVMDLPRMIETVKEYDVESIAHLAIKYDQISPHSTLTDTLEGMANILELTRQMDLRRIIYTSSGAAYPDLGWEGKITEETLFPQTFPYGIYTAQKCGCDMIGLLYAEQYGVDFVSCRIAANYGPPRIATSGGHGAGSITTMLINGIEGKPTILDKGGDHKIPNAYVLDTAEGLSLVLKAKKLRHKVYNIAGENLYSIFEIAEIVKTLIPKADIRIGPGLLPTRNWKRPPFDLTRIREDLGFTPKNDNLNKGATTYFEWLEKVKQ